MDIVKAKKYGAILEIIILVSVAVFLVQKLIVKYYVADIQDNIRTNRNNPLITMFKDLMGKPAGSAATQESSKTGFSSLIMQKVKKVFKPLLAGFLNIFKSFYKMFDKIIGPGLQKLRTMFNPMRTMLRKITEFFYARIKNAIIGVLYTFHKMRNLMRRSISGFNLLFHTLEHTKNTFQSMLTSPQVKMSVGMLSVVEWIADIAISLGGGPEGFKNTCFEGNTPIKLYNGHYILIKNIKAGDVLYDGSRVISKHEFLNDEYIYNYNDIYVSGKHIVKDNNKWRVIAECADSKLTNQKPYYLYCMSTSSGKININNIIFKDFGESCNKFVNYTINSLILTDLNKIHNIALDASAYAYDSPNLESGFEGDTEVELDDGEIKKIKNIQIGDILRDCNKVLGIVILDGTQFDFYNDRGTIVTQNMKTKFSGIWRNIEKTSADKLTYRPNYAYHLITEKETIPIYFAKIYRDYNETYDKTINSEIEKIILNI